MFPRKSERSKLSGSGAVVRVKYGKDTHEVYSEVAATRLLWALGFYADEMYPVRLKCLQCPEKDPTRPKKDEPRIDLIIDTHVTII